MTMIRHFALAISLTLFAIPLSALAQTSSDAIASPQQGDRPSAQATAPLVMVSASARGVRYAALGEVQQSRLQVFAASGAEVYDSGLRLGNLIDWRPADRQGQPLPGGPYLTLLTVTDFSGRATRKYVTAVLESGQVFLQQSSVEELSAAQSSLLEGGKRDGDFRPVDRIGAAGLNVAAAPSAEGLGTQAGGAYPPASGPSLPADTSAPQESLAPTGAGTAGKLAKWTTSTYLGNSVITESASKIGINLTPTATLQVNGPLLPTLATNGTKAPVLLMTSGGKGGNTTGTTGQSAGAM